MRIMLFRCDECKKEETRLGLPPGWLEVRFFSPAHDRDFYYHFCGYPHLVAWSAKRNSFYKGDVVNAEDKDL